jgi:hypothetical protein
MSATERDSPALEAYVAGIGLLGAGLTDWTSAAQVLAGTVPYRASPTVVPIPAALPSAERRRAGATVRLAMAAAAQAVRAAALDPRGLLSVFASSGGDGQICHEICQTLASSERQISPTVFHNSVHNAAAGYWSIATGATAASTVLCAYDASFAAGLLEALSLLRASCAPVLLSAYETSYPEPLRGKRPLPDAFAVALVLSPSRAGPTSGHLRLTLTGESPGTLPDPQLERLRSAVPAARSLPLMRLLARGEAGRVVLDYLDEQRIALEVS